MTRKKKNRISVRLNMNGDLKEKFQFLKEKTGSKTNTGLIRMLVNLRYEEEIRKEEETEH